MALVLKRLFVLVALFESDSLVVSVFLSKKLTMSSGDILKEEFIWSVLSKKSEEILEILAGIKLLIEIAFICRFKSASVLAFQGVCPVNI